jgi:hypothetical protein
MEVEMIFYLILSVFNITVRLETGAPSYRYISNSE